MRQRRVRLARRLTALSFMAATTFGGIQPAGAKEANVQVINVCDDNGLNDAPCSPFACIDYHPAATRRIFYQAGIIVNFLAPRKLDSTAFLNPGILNDPAQGYQFGNPTDPAHKLINLPNHGQTLERNVLDLWLVNTLPHNPNATGASTAVQPLAAD